MGAIGLFTWQRIDWLSKQEYLRAQVMLDRKIDLVERINADVGALVADAECVIAVIDKLSAGDQENEVITLHDGQRSEVIELYDEEQAKWFGVTASHHALLVFYYSHDVSEAFAEDVVASTRTLDVRVYKYASERTEENYCQAYRALQEVRHRLQGWNAEALKCLQSR